MVIRKKVEEKYQKRYICIKNTNTIMSLDEIEKSSREKGIHSLVFDEIIKP